MRASRHDVSTPGAPYGSVQEKEKGMQETQFTDMSSHYRAVIVPWAECSTLLGHEHHGDWEDDSLLLTLVRERYAWLPHEALKWTDPIGVGFYDPRAS
jgi:hypothetical protein